MKRSRISGWFAAVVYGFFVALWQIPILLQPNSIPFWRNAVFSDLLVSHWPNALFIHRAIRLWNQIPLWNPTILSGYPFFADPLAGVWYPPLWLAAAYPRSITFNLLFLGHLVWAGYGMWRLAQSEGLSDFAALVSGLIFIGAPKWSAHIGLGHIGLVCAVSWTPWLLLGIREAITAIAMSRAGIVQVLSKNGLLLAIIFFADPRWLLPSLVLLLIYAFHVVNAQNLNLRNRLAIMARWGTGTGLFALGTAAGFASALLVFVQRSTRSLIDTTSVDPFALQWMDFIGLITFKTDHPETFIYLGVSACFFALVGILLGRRKSWFWYAAAVIGLLMSMGGNLPYIGEWLHSLPAASLLRVPPRWFFLSILSLSFFAGLGFETLILAPIRAREYTRSIILFLLFGPAVYFVAIRVGGVSAGQVDLLLVPAVALLPLILARRFGWLHPRTFLIAVLALIAIEFTAVDLLVLEARPAPALMTEEGVIKATIKPYGEGRLFSPSYSVDQLSAAASGLELAHGVHPLQLKSYWSYMARATGFSQDQYSVTLPPFPSGDPQDAWPVRLDLEALGKLNIQTIVSDYALDVQGLSLLSEEEGQFVYQVESSKPRAWVEYNDEEVGMWEPATLSYWSPNRIEVVAQGPGQLVLSELAYPGWRVFIDGSPATEIVDDGILRGVQLGAGDHRVTFVYRPAHLFIGMTLTALTLLVSLILWVRR